MRRRRPRAARNALKPTARRIRRSPRYLGAAIADVPELVRKANPITYISKEDPPFFLQKGTEDCLVPFAQSGLLAEALKAAGPKVAFDKIEGAGHGDMGSPIPRFLAEDHREVAGIRARGVREALTEFQSRFRASHLLGDSPVSSRKALAKWLRLW